jgi:hypothetical protein
MEQAGIALVYLFHIRENFIDFDSSFRMGFFIIYLLIYSLIY